jgi:hypothetical protein
VIDFISLNPSPLHLLNGFTPAPKYLIRYATFPFDNSEYIEYNVFKKTGDV